MHNSDLAAALAFSAVGRAFEAGVRGAQFGAISWLEPTLVLLAILVTLSSALVRFSMALPRNLRRGTLNQSTDGGAADAPLIRG
jgi:hypothetical protein